jgi:5-methylcytosine-specific restriction endonuclease McrA
MSQHSKRDARWKALVPLIKDRDNNQCTQCGSEEDLTIDHVKPLSLFTPQDYEDGKDYDPDYLVTLCRHCNSIKQAREHGTRSTWFDQTWLEMV